MFCIIKRTLHLYKKLQKYLVDTLTLSSVTENDTWQKRLSTSAVSGRSEPRLELRACVHIE